MERIVISIIIGCALCFVSYLVGVKGRVGLVHSYHYNNVTKENLNIFTRLMGLGIFICSIGVLSIGILDIFFSNSVNEIIGFTIACLGLVVLAYSVIKYNRKKDLS